MTVSLHREADSELTAAFRRYKREVGVGVAGRFLKEFKRITKLLETNPGLGTPAGAGRQSFPLRGFPYTVIYREFGACRAWGVASEKRPQRGQFLPDLQAHSAAMGQKAGEKWTAEAVSQPTIPKSDRLLEGGIRILVVRQQSRDPEYGEQRR